MPFFLGPIDAKHGKILAKEGEQEGSDADALERGIKDKIEVTNGNHLEDDSPTYGQRRQPEALRLMKGGGPTRTGALALNRGHAALHPLDVLLVSLRYWFLLPDPPPRGKCRAGK